MVGRAPTAGLAINHQLPHTTIFSLLVLLLRPLVCRVYPLGRIVSRDEEYFVEVTPHPQTEGRYGQDGTVAEYLAQQGAAPYMAAADHYYRLYLQLAEAQEDDESTADAGFEPLDLLDLENHVRQQAARRGTAPAPNLEERVAQHVRWLHEALTGAAPPES
ncbi:hypothetical protein [Alkalilimnicola sp. S0819]|uniref:hypothetical protein n=1 Tax=Alkalilimnicola sp. S0819 TaxID=2613922 RepID=UPI001869B057|nr:hypothetical protein [Alkalilimnicola sp. S0819]